MNTTKYWLMALIVFSVGALTADLQAQVRPKSRTNAQLDRPRTRVIRLASADEPAKEPADPVPQFAEEPAVEPESLESEVAEFGDLAHGESCSCGACLGIDDGELGGYPSCWDASAPCGFGGWVHAEYLMWWLRPMQIPPLVTSGTVASEGVLDETGTRVLLGDQLLNQMYSGFRLRVGLWTDPCRQTAWEADGFMVGEAVDRYSFSGTGATGTGVIARPYFNVLTSETSPNGSEDAELVAYPGELQGTVAVEATSRLYGLGVHCLRTICCSDGCGPSPFGCGSVPVASQLAGLVGWRYMDLSEDLRINEDLTSLLPAPDDGRFLIEDRFGTDNSFNGADIGVLWQGCRGRFSLDLLLRMALGVNHQKVQIAGSTSLSGSTDPANNFENATGGLLAQRTNIGEYSRNRLAVVPELGVTLGYGLSPCWRATVGYTFLYWSSVVRPGNQIDRDVNPDLLPPETVPLVGLERPVFNFVESDLWVNGLSIGLERTW